MKAQFGSLRSFMICACSHCTDDHFTIPDSLVAACLMFCQRFFPRFPDDFADCFSDSADEFGTICLTLSTISTTISSTILPTIFGLRLTRSLTKKSKKVAKIIACLSTKDCNHNCVVGKLGGRVVWEIFVGVRVWLGRGVLLGSEMGHQGLRLREGGLGQFWKGVAEFRGLVGRSSSLSGPLTHDAPSCLDTGSDTGSRWALCELNVGVASWSNCM